MRTQFTTSIMPDLPGTFRPPWAPVPSKRERDRRHDERRGSARKRGYGTAWDKASKGFIRRHPLCLGCEAVGRVTPSEVTDHVVPHRGDQALFWDPANRQPACRWHHDAIKQQLERMWDAGEIVAAELRLDSATAVRLTLR